MQRHREPTTSYHGARIDSARANHTRAQVAAAEANVASLDAQLRDTELLDRPADAQVKLDHAITETNDAINAHQPHTSAQITGTADRLLDNQ